jgi:CBS domain-containing protein
MKARDLMKANPITVRSDAPFLEIQRLLIQAQIGGVPVVNATGDVEGIITAADLLRALDELCDDELDRSEPENEAALLGRLRTLTAHEIGSPEAIWVSPDASIEEVVRHMREEGEHRVLVGSDGRLAGNLTAFDLLEAVKS